MDGKLAFLTQQNVDTAIEKIIQDTDGDFARRAGSKYSVLVNDGIELPFKLIITEAAIIAGADLTHKDFSSNAHYRSQFQEEFGYQILNKKARKCDYDAYRSHSNVHVRKSIIPSGISLPIGSHVLLKYDKSTNTLGIYNPSAEQPEGVSNPKPIHNGEANIEGYIYFSGNGVQDFEKQDECYEINVEFRGFDMKKVDLKIFKVSLGKDYINDEQFLQMKDDRVVCVHPDTKAMATSSISQGEAFLNAKKGDVFFVCRSNESVELIGMFSDNAPFYNANTGYETWTNRSYELLFDAKNPMSYDKELSKWWSPKFNSTFVQIQDDDFHVFEESILTPVFGIKISDIQKKMDLQELPKKYDFSDVRDVRDYFHELKSNKENLFEKLNALDKKKYLRKVLYSLGHKGDLSSQPVVWLRKLITERLINGDEITETVIKELKGVVDSNFSKNVFHAWKSNFRILYSLFYEMHKDLIVEYFLGLINEIRETLEIKSQTKFNLVHLDGAQNQGDDRIWFAIYNKSHKNQKTAKQLLFALSDKIEFGLYEESTKDNSLMTTVDDFDKEKVIGSFRRFKNHILNDSKEMNPFINKAMELLSFKKQVILQGPPGTGKTYLAKQIAKEITGEDASVNGKVRLVQFHPSYSYEDFVRGIEVKTGVEGNVHYKTVNKVLGQIVSDSSNNQNSDESIDQLIVEFADSLRSRLEEGERIQFTDYVPLTSVNEDSFYYESPTQNGHIYFGHLKLIHQNTALANAEISAIPEIQGTTTTARPTYPRILHEWFQEFIANRDLDIDENFEAENDPKYILIIDEINRANLPSVLGELIYALEYRNEPVNGMYEYNGSKALTIPDNLYIIGTMNTADRSVGHIDYAIRRRFAFVDVLPDEKVIKNETGEALFKQVTNLFEKDNLNSDFKKEDVQIGHSYFMIPESGVDGMSEKDIIKMRWEYEIRPILKEYIKDGVLNESVESKIEEIGKTLV